MQNELANYQNLTLKQASVADIVVDRSTLEGPDSQGHYGKITGIRLESGEVIRTKNVVITTGTFLGGEIHVGMFANKRTFMTTTDSNTGLDVFPSGRMGEAASFGLSKSLREAGFKLGRLKTGTPPRLDGRTIDYAKLEAQDGDDPPMPFSYMNGKVSIEVYITRENEYWSPANKITEPASGIPNAYKYTIT